MAEPITYSGYLRLDQLLSAQQPRSSEHDEMLFIVIHQIYELWFKQLLHEFGKLQAELEAVSTTHAMRTLRRSLAILKIVVAQLDVLETMTPTQFTRFRDWLGTSSGFESAQFRELEAVLGRRDRMMVAQYVQGSAERERITAAMSRPSLFDSFVRYLAGQGYAVPAGIANRDVSQPLEASDAMQQVLKKVYDDDTDATAVCELLVDLDEGMQEWRYTTSRWWSGRSAAVGAPAARPEPPTCGPRSASRPSPTCGRSGAWASRYSHSMVAGGLLVTSSTTRLTSGTSLVIRVEIRASTSSGSRAQSAVIASSLVTGRSTTGWP